MLTKKDMNKLSGLLYLLSISQNSSKRGISVPCGLNSEGMPIGFQLIGNHFAEDTVLKAAYTYEQNTNFRGENKPTFKK